MHCETATDVLCGSGDPLYAASATFKSDAVLRGVPVRCCTGTIWCDAASEGCSDGDMCVHSAGAVVFALLAAGGLCDASATGGFELLCRCPSCCAGVLTSD